MSLHKALQKAKNLAKGRYQQNRLIGSSYSRCIAIGDPQAPIETFFEILNHHHLLSPSGMLRDHVSLVVTGDYFDWGSPPERAQASQSGLELLSWLAAHPEDQVNLILGNHDLGRVGELVSFDDQEFAKLYEQASLAYQQGNVDRDLEEELCARFPQIPTAEVAARDFSSFCQAQRILVTGLLRANRFKIAMAKGEHILISHAGITCEVLNRLKINPNEGAKKIAEVLNQHLEHAVSNWQAGPLQISGLHTPGSRAQGEGVGIFYHRPSNPDIKTNEDKQSIGMLKRRYDPRDLPLGITQVIGHISDTKCRHLLGSWIQDKESIQGAIRTLESNGKNVSYRIGRPQVLADSQQAKLIFIDGQMHRTPPSEYEILDVQELSMKG